MPVVYSRAETRNGRAATTRTSRGTITQSARQTVVARTVPSARGEVKPRKPIAPRAIIKFAGEWGSFEFAIKSSSIVGVKDLSMSVSIETETKVAGNENYITRKYYNPTEIKMTGIFSATMGVKDVRAASWELMNLMRLGRTGYVYCGSDKLLAPMVIGVSAQANNIEIGANGKWSYCEVPIVLKQCEKYGGGTAGTTSSGGGGGGSGGSGGGRGRSGRSGSGSGVSASQISSAIQAVQSAVQSAQRQSSGYSPARYGSQRITGTPQQFGYKPPGRSAQ